MTFEEYKKNLAPKSNLPAPRKANEGSQDPKWKNTEVFERKEEIYFAKEVEVKVKDTKPRERKGPERIDISPRGLIEDHTDRERDDERGFRGGRGCRGGRGGRGGRGDFGGDRPAYSGSRPAKTPAGKPPSLADQSAFPTLGA